MYSSFRRRGLVLNAYGGSEGRIKGERYVSIPPFPPFSRLHAVRMPPQLKRRRRTNLTLDSCERRVLADKVNVIQAGLK